MPRIDDGSAASGPGRQIKAAWVTLSVDEAHELHQALSLWAEDAAAGESDPQWHTHVTDEHGNEFTLAVEQPTG
jgi:hypothetical protein